MPNTKIVEELAEAVVGAIGDATFSQQFPTERSYADWELPFDDQESRELRCDVVVSTKPTADLGTRGSLDYKIPVDIVIRRGLGQETQDEDTGRVAQEEVDALVRLVIEMHSALCPLRLPDFKDGSWESTEIRALYIPAHLRTKRQFTGVVRVTFDVEVKR